jgi:hypothetical protein
MTAEPTATKTWISLTVDDPCPAAVPFPQSRREPFPRRATPSIRSATSDENAT